jgi:hypothetical protein
LELRWFFPGDLPQDIKFWFENLDDASYLVQEKRREDYQLPIPSCDYISIKLREERLEIKWRSQREHFSALSGRIKGTEEKWTKWAWISDPKNNSSYESFKIGEPFGPTIKIEKARNTRRFEILNRNTYNDTLLHSRPIKQIKEGITGYSIEITNIKSLDKSWWSLALETFGTEERKIIHAAVEQLLNTYSGPALREESSYGYSHWLVNHARG